MATIAVRLPRPRRPAPTRQRDDTTTRRPFVARHEPPVDTSEPLAAHTTDEPSARGYTIEMQAPLLPSGPLDSPSSEPATSLALEHQDQDRAHAHATMTTGPRDAHASSRSTATLEVPALGSGPIAVVEALLKSPASLLHAMRDGRGTLGRLSLVIAASITIVGLVTASFGGGVQFLIVPLKMTLGIFVCALICFPSLHIFSCLSGARQSVRETWGALLMGVALMALLLLGFAPIAWIFSQATTSVAFVGGLHLLFLALSTLLGLGLVNRTLGAMNQAPVRGLRLWGSLFMIVLFQMTTTLRPLVGAATGWALEGRLFFLTHWLRELGS